MGVVRLWMPEILKPQDGPQTTFLSTNADIALYGLADCLTVGNQRLWIVTVQIKKAFVNGIDFLPW